MKSGVSVLCTVPAWAALIRVAQEGKAGALGRDIAQPLCRLPPRACACGAALCMTGQPRGTAQPGVCSAAAAREASRLLVCVVRRSYRPNKSCYLNRVSTKSHRATCREPDPAFAIGPTEISSWHHHAALTKLGHLCLPRRAHRDAGRSATNPPRPRPPRLSLSHNDCLPACPHTALPPWLGALRAGQSSCPPRMATCPTAMRRARSLKSTCPHTASTLRPWSAASTKTCGPTSTFT